MNEENKLFKQIEEGVFLTIKTDLDLLRNSCVTYYKDKNKYSSNSVEKYETKTILSIYL